ncbi:MAG: TRAP transporter substrate-binding protein [Propylenella sp.]
MDRRSFIKKAGLATGAAATAAAFPMPAIAQGMMELKMVMTWPKNYPALGTGAQRVCDRIATMTEGRIKVTLFGAGELVPPFESFDAVSQGTADMYQGAEYYWQGKHKGFNFFAAVPMGLTASEMNAWVHYGGGQELWDELAGGFGIKSFLAGNTGAQMGGWFREEVNTPEDLKGLTFRMPGFGGEVLRKVGMNAVALPGAEIFPALQAGTIDATEWVGPWLDLAFGFQKIVKFYYGPGFHEPGTALAIGINKGVWDKLSPTDQEIVKTACHAENGIMYDEINANNGPALDELINKHGVQVKRFSDEIFETFAKASEELIPTLIDDDLGQRIFDSFSAARKNIGSWTNLQERSFVELRAKFVA